MAPLSHRKIIPLQRRANHARHPRWSAAFSRLDARVSELERRLHKLDRRYSGMKPLARMQAGALLSVLMHAVVILGIAFKVPDPKFFKDTSRPMDVVLVNAKTESKPRQADAYAQHNLDGGGNTDADRRAKSPLPVTRHSKTHSDVALAQRRVEQLEQQSRQIMTQPKPAPAAVPVAPAQPEPQAETAPGPTAADLLQRSADIARLEAQISRDWENYQKRPRRKFVGARTQEFRFARYVEDWRLKVERIGELNYPQAARDQRLYGSLVVTVSIKADGALEKVEINRPSGHKLLDEAAVRIVKLSAPFAPFPADISKDTDILSITRTWTFTRADRLLTE
jgi:periplasmic protein TonB